MHHTYLTTINSILDSTTADLNLDLGFHIRIQRRLNIQRISDGTSNTLALHHLESLNDANVTLLTTVDDDNHNATSQTAIIHVVHHDNQNDAVDPSDPTANLWRYPATARHIIDGDTLDAIIDLGFGIRITERLRFANIQAPAIIGIPADAPEYIRGMKAKQFVEQRLTANNNRLQISTSKQGKWRRWLATIQLADNTAGTTLNQELIDNQLADDWRTYQKRQQARAVVRTQFDIDRSLKSKLEMHAKQQEISMTQLIRQALEQFIQT